MELSDDFDDDEVLSILLTINSTPNWDSRKIRIKNYMTKIL